MLNFLPNIVSAMGDACNPAEGAHKFFGLPHWYEYMSGERDAFGRCVTTIEWLNFEQVWPIGLAIIDILLRIVALVAFGYIIYAGFMYITSNGEPEKTKNAKDTILNALIGLVIAIVASAVVSYIGNSIK
jgi:uncharacterized membrane protein YphA (DoxX/SURF4 family)